jgi:hypothetical protein
MKFSSPVYKYLLLGIVLATVGFVLIAGYVFNSAQSYTAELDLKLDAASIGDEGLPLFVAANPKQLEYQEGLPIFTQAIKIPIYLQHLPANKSFKVTGTVKTSNEPMQVGVVCDSCNYNKQLFFPTNLPSPDYNLRCELEGHYVYAQSISLESCSGLNSIADLLALANRTNKTVDLQGAIIDKTKILANNAPTSDPGLVSYDLGAQPDLNYYINVPKTLQLKATTKLAQDTIYVDNAIKIEVFSVNWELLASHDFHSQKRTETVNVLVDLEKAGTYIVRLKLQSGVEMINLDVNSSQLVRFDGLTPTTSLQQGYFQPFFVQSSYTDHPDIIITKAKILQAGDSSSFEFNLSPEFLASIDNVQNLSIVMSPAKHRYGTDYLKTRNFVIQRLTVKVYDEN